MVTWTCALAALNARAPATTIDKTNSFDLIHLIFKLEDNDKGMQ
jgi:hypothetical protein